MTYLLNCACRSRGPLKWGSSPSNGPNESKPITSTLKAGLTCQRHISRGRQLSHVPCGHLALSASGTQPLSPYPTRASYSRRQRAWRRCGALRSTDSTLESCVDHISGLHIFVVVLLLVCLTESQLHFLMVELNFEDEPFCARFEPSFHRNKLDTI